MKFKHLLLTGFILGTALLARADDSVITMDLSTTSDTVELSTTPLGSSFMRHLANEYQADIKLLSKFEKKGFGRAETITLLLISEKAMKPLKELGNERLKDKTSLRAIAERSGINYDDLYLIVYDIKRDIEAMGDNDLPLPVYDKKELTDEEKARIRKKQRIEEKQKKREAKEKLKEEKKP